MNLLDLLPVWAKLAIAAAIAATLASAAAWFVHHERDIGRADVQAQWNAETAARIQAALDATAENRRIENRRQSVAAEIQQRKDDELKNINARLARALGELRNRPERPAGGALAGDPATATACTGAGLYRPDAAFLIGEAAAAARIAAERDACHDRYDSLTVKP